MSGSLRIIGGSGRDRGSTRGFLTADVGGRSLKVFPPSSGWPRRFRLERDDDGPRGVLPFSNHHGTAAAGRQQPVR